jgi:hypothetical protein
MISMRNYKKKTRDNLQISNNTDGGTYHVILCKVFKFGQYHINHRGLYELSGSFDMIIHSGSFRHSILEQDFKFFFL